MMATEDQYCMSAIYVKVKLHTWNQGLLIFSLSFGLFPKHKNLNFLRIQMDTGGGGGYLLSIHTNNGAVVQPAGKDYANIRP